MELHHHGKRSDDLGYYGDDTGRTYPHVERFLRIGFSLTSGNKTMLASIYRWSRLAAGILSVLLALPAHADSVPGQTNQDIDLFLVNPAVAAGRPNVLIIWDNTANWGATGGGPNCIQPREASAQPSRLGVK